MSLMEQTGAAERLGSVSSGNALELRGVTKMFGALAAIRDITLTVGSGERRAVLGGEATSRQAARLHPPRAPSPGCP